MAWGKLSQLFVFNPSWGPREGEEHKKVIYFWPPETPENKQVRAIGLIEAVVRFGETFTAEAAESLHNEKTRQVWRQVEAGYYCALTVTLPCVRRLGKDGTEQVEYRAEEVSDSVLLAVVTRAHHMFRLFQGGLAKLHQSGGESSVREQVEHFYSRYIATLRLEGASLLEEWGGLQYLPLKAEPFLRVQTLVTRTQSSQSSIDSCLFLQQGQLVWSGLEPQATRLLVHYLTTSLLPGLPQLPSPSPTAPHQGRFLVGGSLGSPLPVVHLGDSCYHLLVYHAINSSLVMLLDCPPSPLTYSDLDTTLGPQLSDLSADLTLQWSQGKEAANPTSGDQVKFLYFNAANYAVKSTVEAGSELLVGLAGDLASDLGSNGGEVTAKLSTDQWVVVRVSGVRTIIVLLNQRNLNLMEVTEEVARLDKSSFGSVCIL